MTEEVISNSIWRGRFFRYAPLFLWVGVIFLTSSSRVSVCRSSEVLRPILEFLFPGASNETIYIYQVIIRKFAHFIEYSALAFFASRAFWSSNVRNLRKHWHIVALLLVLTIAAMDEIRQSFDPTRTGLFTDVLLDGFSGVAAIGISFVYKKFRSN